MCVATWTIHHIYLIQKKYTFDIQRNYIITYLFFLLFRHIYTFVHTSIHIYNICTRIFFSLFSRLLKIIGLFCRILSLL